MLIGTKNLKVEIDEKNGNILSVKKGQKEFLNPDIRQPLFRVCFMNELGIQERVPSDSARHIVFSEENHIFCWKYEAVSGKAFDAKAWMFVGEDGHLHVSMEFDNKTAESVEWVEMASLTVPRDLRLNGGDSVYFSPVTEGGLIEDIDLREKFMGTRYRDVTFGNDGGLIGLYPRTALMQFMAYYSPLGGVYVGAHDENYHTKVLELRPENARSMTLEHRVFTAAAKGAYKIGYDVVLAGFAGDWYEAADIYRNWFERSALKPVSLSENKSLPKWMEDSPVILIYPIRGVMDTGDMTPNCYYPYEKGVEYVNRIAERLGCRVMALMMHWEGTAPWSTPYVWPPFGGEEGFLKAVRLLHEKGNLVGVYCSGIGWTRESVIWPQYRPGTEYRGVRAEDITVKGPGNTISLSKSITTIRTGYDVCPYPEVISDIVADEVEKIAESGVDYCQFFDQNWDGNSKFCYASDHGHPAGAGSWQTLAMKHIQRKANERIKACGSEMVLGTEGAAAEPFITELPFNDLRFNKWYYHGVPVPAYSYITHEYTTNFSGNNCGVGHALNLYDNPSNVAFTLAYAFTAGNILSILLGTEGNVHWGWCVDWEGGSPKNQEALWNFTAHLNAWRKHAKEFLYFGRMEKPEPIEGIDTYHLLRAEEGYAEFPELLYTAWSSSDKKVQFVVNFLETEKSFTLKKEVVLYTEPQAQGQKVCNGESIKIPAYTAYMLEL